MIPALADERVEALRQRLGLADPRVVTEVAEPGAEPPTVEIAPIRPRLPRRPKPLAKAVAKRYTAPVLDPVLHRLAVTLGPTVTTVVAERLLGRIEPELHRLTAEVEVLKGEVAAGGTARRTKARLDDLTHRLNRLEGD